MFRRLGLFKRMMETLGSGPRAKKCMVAVCGIGPHVDKRGQKNDHIEAKGKVVFWSVHVVSFSQKSHSFFSLSAFSVSIGPFRKTERS